MGRLTLNILLSFAQFEREVTGERNRDKIALSKKKGMWMGGYAPLGLDVIDRKLLANEKEADLVRRIFDRFVKLGRHGGRKMILSPTGQPVNPDRNPDADVTLVNALVRAHRWNRWLASGKYDNVQDIAAVEGISSPSYASRILRLVLLAPDIQETILNGTQPATLTLADLMGPFPLDWEGQQVGFGF